jgi:hypothetical protein
MAQQSDRPVSVESFAHGLPQRFLRCRELGHVWRPSTVSREPGGGGFTRKLRCAECRTERQQLLDSRGHVIRNAYHYPDGYLADGTVERGHYSRDIFRLEAVIRYLDKEAS